jgi:glutathione synthase/RimK-type ligase-like ATP-grasp enzyme
MKKIYLLTDYKGYFGSKQKASPFKSGMDKDLLKKYFHKYGYIVKYLSFSEIDFREMDFKNKYVLYTSSEDPGYHYKDYIEDIILALHYQGAILLPRYEFLRANNNKIFMEILRDLSRLKEIKNIKSFHLGVIEDLQKKQITTETQNVIKAAKGAMGRSVFLSKNKNDLIKKGKKISRTSFLYKELWDLKNYIKHKGFIRSSKYREKFIIQNYISGLTDDWKILIYYNKYYILNRQNRKNDFRASGSGKFNFVKNVPKGILDYANLVYGEFKTPNLSIDVAYDGKDYYLLEFQAIYFGTKTIEFAPFYFVRKNTGWQISEEKSILEEVYVDSICHYLGEIK